MSSRPVRSALGQVIQVTTPTISHTYFYDHAARLQTVRDSRGDKTLTYTWTAGGRLATLRDGEGSRTDYTYTEPRGGEASDPRRSVRREGPHACRQGQPFSPPRGPYRDGRTAAPPRTLPRPVAFEGSTFSTSTTPQVPRRATPGGLGPQWACPEPVERGDGGLQL